MNHVVAVAVQLLWGGGCGDVDYNADGDAGDDADDRGLSV